MKICICILVLLVSLGAEDFITKMEYAKMLYSNPRGIGCILCHGKKGEGSVIAKYREKGKQKELRAPAINSLSKEKFFKALDSSDSIMPQYFLTDNEMEILYFYVTSEVNK
jgi:hypothetical protein